jgi:fermentation-respiration switch protein FrsA (DUF1100 family)
MEAAQMIDINKIDYSLLDRPEILMFLFHPRPEWGKPHPVEGAQDVLIPVEDDVLVGGRFYIAGKEAPNILFFHGNGEIVADYEDLAPLYTKRGLNFLPVDYRGYGRSTGRPTITAMMRDCHVIFEYARNWLGKKGCKGPFVVMGRSLGSASVLELISCYAREIDGLIVESGFAYAGPLLQLLGIELKRLGVTEEEGFRNIDKIRTFPKPTLIIHAEYDHIIPFSEGRALYEACPADDKRLLMIPKANHNDIFARGIEPYMEAVKELTGKAGVRAQGSGLRPE